MALRLTSHASTNGFRVLGKEDRLAVAEAHVSGSISMLGSLDT